MEAVRTAAVRRPGPRDLRATRTARGESLGYSAVWCRGAKLLEPAKDDERKIEEYIIMNVRIEP
jgi:hypothetical protein